jgi:hypothetical protein
MALIELDSGPWAFFGARLAIRRTWKTNPPSDRIFPTSLPVLTEYLIHPMPGPRVTYAPMGKLNLQNEADVHDPGHVGTLSHSIPKPRRALN